MSKKKLTLDNIRVHLEKNYYGDSFSPYSAAAKFGQNICPIILEFLAIFEHITCKNPDKMDDKLKDLIRNLTNTKTNDSWINEQRLTEIYNFLMSVFYKNKKRTEPILSLSDPEQIGEFIINNAGASGSIDDRNDILFLFIRLAKKFEKYILYDFISDNACLIKEANLNKTISFVEKLIYIEDTDTDFEFNSL